MEENIILLTDSYKEGHWNQYPPTTEGVFSYFEARDGAKFRETTFFGLQYLLKRYLEGVVVTRQKIDEAEALCLAHFGKNMFNKKGWEHILEHHGGKLPVRIKAVKEGTTVPISNAMMTIENTDPKCYWLTNHLETILSQIWYTCTVATLSRNVKHIAKDFLERTGCPMDGLGFMLHDFGFRGTSSIESAGLGGAAHLVNFLGTDTIQAMTMIQKYYNAGVCAYSVPASEHSVMTSKGPEGEAEMFDRMLDIYPDGIVSIVSDSYDIFGSVEAFVKRNRDRILARDGKVVIRPDSGDPIFTVLKLLEILYKEIGGAENERGFKVLHPTIGLIWGDGLDREKIYDILRSMADHGWAASNIVFGMGAGLLQKVDRDTQRFAFKCSAQKQGDVWVDIFKDPQDKTKISKAGRLALQKVGDRYVTHREAEFNGENLLETVFENGVITRTQTFEEIRNLANQ